MKTFKIAIVGAGPSGYFSAMALQKLEDDFLNFQIDLFERLPTPYGLVRSGVAPDHPKIKTVTKTFEKVSLHERFRLIANVEVGNDIPLDELSACYDAVVIAIGTAKGRRLGIPGETLANSFSSAEFVPWYNGHPDFQSLEVDLSGERAIVIGAGNVALDVARILTMNSQNLKQTDVSSEALKILEDSKLKEVWILSRRGPENVAFTSPELRELEKLEEFNIVIDPEDLRESYSRVAIEGDKGAKAKLDCFQSMTERKFSSTVRTLRFVFNHRPLRIEGRNKVADMVVIGPKGESRISTGLVISAIGYELGNSFGLEVQDNHLKNTDGFIANNLFVVGWARRGPSGIIGTNKSDASAVMETLVDFLRDAVPRRSSGLASLNALKIVDLEGWRRIDAEELSKGALEGKSRSKILQIEEMLEVAQNSSI